jgi:hypothetical protein
VYNDWCGEALAIKEFNELEIPRKLQDKTKFITRVFICNIFDHPILSGEKKNDLPLAMKFNL